jgi:nitrogen permease regulator 2-like protein
LAQSIPLIDFAQVADFIIPRQELCDRLVTVCNNGYRVVGYPVCISNRTRYDRNEFLFNMAFILDESLEIGAYASVVKKLARVLRNLEEQGGFLIRDHDEHSALETATHDHNPNGADDASLFSPPRPSGGSKVYALCESVLEDLNKYGECMIPIGNWFFPAAIEAY